MNLRKNILTFFALTIILLMPLADAFAFTNGQAAALELGQPNDANPFDSNTANNGGISASSLNIPGDMALDSAGNLWVADRFNNRVLRYDAPFTNGEAAVLELGQPNDANPFDSNTANNGGISASTLSAPFGIALDTAGNLWVADTSNHRVLRYDAPFTNGEAAVLELGQPNDANPFDSNTANNGGISASSLSAPVGVALDTAGNLLVVDQFNSRVLRYDAPFTNGEAAVLELGQPNDANPFDSNTANNGGISASTLSFPGGVALDSAGNLWVADISNSRVLKYDAPFTNGEAAVLELGQPNDANPFDSGISNNGGISASSLSNPVGVALDTAGNLLVVDQSNSRVLRYDAPFTNGEAAVRVLGQPNDANPFDSNTANNGGISASSLNVPFGIALDGVGNLWVADTSNNRALRFLESVSGTQVTGNVNVLTQTCGLSVISGAPISYGDLFTGDTSTEKTLVLDNTGTSTATLQVKGSNWLDGSLINRMNVDNTKYSITTGTYASKTSLLTTDQTITGSMSPTVNLDTFWQLQVNLLVPFSGALTQTMDFTTTC